jgi:hypothetical protein
MGLFNFLKKRSLAKKLVAAAKSGDVALVEKLLAEGANVNARNKSGETALMKAAWHGHTETVQFLLEKGTNIHATDKDGWTALMFAAGKGHTETVKLLLEKGTNIHATEKDDWTALMLAAGNGHTETVKLLLEKCADVNARDSNEEKNEDKWMPANPRFLSNMPLSSLVRIFIFTNGDGQTVLSCPVASGTLADTVGAPLNQFLGKAPLDVIARSNTAAQIKQSGQFPDSAWAAMSRIDMDAANKAQMGVYKSVVRTFDNPTTKESGVCVLLYQK